jgi:Putative auto-transporter adhesin, head GIN domain
MRNLCLGLVMLTVATSSCRFLGGERVRGNGNAKTVERSLAAFKDVEASDIIHLYLTQGPQVPVKIETDENLMDFVEIEQVGNRISVKTRDGYNLDPTDKIKVYITIPEYHSISVSGAGSIQTTSKITNADGLDISLSGAGGIKMELDAPSVKVDISGAGSATLVGQTKDFEMDISGAGDAHCFDLLSENTRVDISGAGKADVFASIKLDAQVSGAGSVIYKGGATNIKQDVTGAGKVRKAD